MAITTFGTGGFKNRAARLASRLARDRYSHRERAYIMSKTAAAKFEQLYAEGWDAEFFGDELVPPPGPDPASTRDGQFAIEMRKILVEKGAIAGQHDSSVVATAYGPLSCSTGKGFCVMCRFLEPGAAIAHGLVGPSGKYNFHPDKPPQSAKAFSTWLSAVSSEFSLFVDRTNPTAKRRSRARRPCC